MKQSFFLSFFLLPFIGFFLSCNAPKTPTKKNIEETSSEVKSTETTTPVPFPVYTSYAQLEPLFHQKTDTTYVINFWATWCKPCVAELPYFEQLNETYQNEKVRVVLVSMDMAKKIESDLVPFVKERNLKSDVIALLDSDYNAWIDKVSPEWSGAIPVTLIYNSINRAFYEKQFHDFEELDAALKAVQKG